MDGSIDLSEPAPPTNISEVQRAVSPLVRSELGEQAVGHIRTARQIVQANVAFASSTVLPEHAEQALAQLHRALSEIDLALAELTTSKIDLAELERRAERDALTGLANRDLFFDRCDHAMSRLSRTTDQMAVLFIDLDQFGRVNDAFGHAGGDRVLVVIGERLAEVLRPGDTLARLGGDEFVVLCEDLGSPAESILVAERLLGATAAPVSISGTVVYITSSIGIAMTESRDDSVVDLLGRADDAMYRAKAHGGARFEMAPPPSRRRLTPELRQLG